jgi:hypothetical protein
MRITTFIMRGCLTFDYINGRTSVLDRHWVRPFLRQEDTLDEVYINAKEALAAYCVTLLEQNRVLSAPSDVFKINLPEDAFVSLVEADLLDVPQPLTA